MIGLFLGENENRTTALISEVYSICRLKRNLYNQITQWKMLILEYTITGTAAYIVKNKKKGGGGHISVRPQLLTCTPLVAPLFSMSGFGHVQ